MVVRSESKKEPFGSLLEREEEPFEPLLKPSDVIHRSKKSELLDEETVCLQKISDTFTKAKPGILYRLKGVFPQDSDSYFLLEFSYGANEKIHSFEEQCIHFQEKCSKERVLSTFTYRQFPSENSFSLYYKIHSLIPWGSPGRKALEMFKALDKKVEKLPQLFKKQVSPPPLFPCSVL